MLEEYKGSCKNCPDFSEKAFILHRLQKRYWPRLLFSPLRELPVLMDKTSSSWRAELHQAATGQEPKTGQPSFLTQWVALENPSSINIQTLSLEVGRWRGLRKRSHVGHCLPWVFTATAQDEAVDASHFHPTVWSLWPNRDIASNAELFPPANRYLDYPAAALCFWFRTQCYWESKTFPGLKVALEAHPSSSLFIKNGLSQAKITDVFPLLLMCRPWRAFSHKGSWLRYSTVPL